MRFFEKRLETFNCICYYNLRTTGCGAVGSALDWGSRGRKFKSCHSDHQKTYLSAKGRVCLFLCIKKVDLLYGLSSYYWGLAPSHMCYKVMQICPPIRKLRVLDIGCGEGKDAVFFARNGYIVDAFDIAIMGIEKTKRLADKIGVHINAFQANLLDYRLEHQYDIIFSSGLFHYIPVDIRNQLISDYQEHTAPNGIHSLNVFVKNLS